MRTRVGYAGGTTKDPTYRRIGDHTEVFQVDYDPKRITFAKLVEHVFESHDPCRRSWSTQYEAIVFYGDEAELETIEAAVAKIEKARKRTVHTRITKLDRFYFAEDYHQKYSLRGEPRVFKSVRALFDSERAFSESTAATKVNAHLAGQLSLPELRRELAKVGLRAVGERSLEGVLVAEPEPEKPSEKPTSRPSAVR